MQVKVSGVWKSALPFARVSGVWRDADYGYVKVSGTWRKFYRRKDLYYNGTITLAYANVLGPEYAAKVSNTGVVIQGSVSPLADKDGRYLANIQLLPVASDGYGPFRVISLTYYGNVSGAGIDIPALTWGGVKSVEQLYNGAYISSFYVTLWRFGFAVDLPYAGARNMYY